MKLTKRELQRKYHAVEALSGRTLPGRESEGKVATLLRMYLMLPFQAVEDAINRSFKDIPVPDEYEGERMPSRITDLRGAAREEILSQMIEIRDIPEDLKIKKEDLPKVSKQMEANQSGVANIIANLGPELYDSFDSDEEQSFLASLTKLELAE